MIPPSPSYPQKGRSISFNPIILYFMLIHKSESLLTQSIYFYFNTHKCSPNIVFIVRRFRNYHSGPV